MPGDHEDAGNPEPRFRPYTENDADVCLKMFDANCPRYFAPNERADFAAFLATNPNGYELCLVDGTPVGAFGLTGHDALGSLNWIMIVPSTQGAGVGGAIMRRIIERGRTQRLRRIDIAASHKSQGFFAKFGAITMSTTPNGWGPGMHRVDMELTIPRSAS